MLVTLCVAGFGAAACGSSGSTSTSTTGADAAVQAAVENGAVAAKTDASGIEWLCKPGATADPCVGDLSTTVLPESGPSTVQHDSIPAEPSIDCFYVYPTVSLQQGVTADLHIDPAEISMARLQASRFSQICKVYAPMYRQVTLRGLFAGAQTATAVAAAYAGVQSAWKDYLAHYSHGRGVLVIGHSQGAAMLISLLKHQVDANPSQRKLLVSAILLGGNVTVPIGRTVGGSFQHIPACTASSQVGCVLAYSSFDQPPSTNSPFGRPGLGVSSMSDGSSTAGLQVLCTNPADLSGTAAATLTPYFPTRSQHAGLDGTAQLTAPDLPTRWVAEPRLYTGQCLSQGGATWLQVSAPITAGDTRQVARQTIGPGWGLHLVDMNVAMGDLVDVARVETAAYTHRA